MRNSQPALQNHQLRAHSCTLLPFCQHRCTMKQEDLLPTATRTYPTSAAGQGIYTKAAKHKRWQPRQRLHAT
jgi:hypothetical protein